MVNKQGSQVEIKSSAGVHHKRNVTHLQKYEEKKSQAETTPSNPNETAVKKPRKMSGGGEESSSINRQPEKLRDYELG